MKNFSRRSFLKSGTAAGIGIAFIPNLISCSPNTQKLRFAMIGVGGRGQASWSQVPVESLVAMCDVDDRQTEEAKKAVPNAKWYKDFRKMFDEMANEIDAVMIATPDHTHFPAAMAAMELGKHVFVEKPLAHNIWQLRTLKKAAKHYGIVSQMGNQGHTTNGIRLVKEWYEAGVLGEVKEVIAWQGKIDFEKDSYFAQPNSFPPEEQAIPDGLDWELWQGPVSERPFNKLYAPRTWRGFYDYGNGKLGDWCCHTLDAPFWALDLGLPETVEAFVKDPVADHSFVATESVVTWNFGARGNKAPVTMKWYEGIEKPQVKPEWGLNELPDAGMIMIGDKQTLFTGMRPNNPRLLVPEEEWNVFLKDAPAQKFPRVGEEKPVQEWVDAIKNGTLPGSNFDYSASLMEMAQVGVLAQRFGGKITYDAQNMKALDRPELDPYIKETPREGWAYGENI
ncbi:Gfo/Idh/MocA family oxidoreductase [Maribellus sp. YY47]|uniref:Gfo/Idh/MocA family protein n=1 Tax=Maribellus sp. YY47 TaxID=2929486 RepID=UPI0020016E0C|nr:Gfo/Idh/MocA family oxidoreductase [Maribellus sp. YY47]MCK3684025.1 Gfo/Idh/MocA family oxidoreductase [Maribellus sp. YY47]